MMERRSLPKLLAAASAGPSLESPAFGWKSGQTAGPKGSYKAARTVNEYREFLPGERATLAAAPATVPAITEASAI
jgi:hypothetical protein